jgi:membrane protease YdiL (CAAX protease family)
MNPIPLERHPRRHPPGIGLALLLYAGYLAIFFATWSVNGADYLRIGESSDTLRLWYATPTLLGSLFLVVAITWLGWWRPVLFDRSRAGPRWIAVLPLAMAAVIAGNLLALPSERLTAPLLLWAALGAVGVGFAEEVITRGSMVAALRTRFGEGAVWLLGTLLFSALHVPNALFGLPLWAMPVQLLLTFVMGSALYAMRRMSGTLLLPIALHGLWDSSLFLAAATGAQVSNLQFLVYPLAIACVVALLRRTWRERVPNL